MRDYATMIKALRHCVENTDCLNCPYYTFCDNDVMIIAADEIEELVAKVPTWKPASAPPRKDGWYWVYAPSYGGGSSSSLRCVNGGFMLSRYFCGKWSIEHGYHKRPNCVKYWMPLPEPPKEVDNG